MPCSNLRQCEVDGKKGYFHCWEQKSEIIGPSPMIGGHGGGVITYTLAIVELEDGSIITALPYHIKFTDKEEDSLSDEECARIIDEPHGSD